MNFSLYQQFNGTLMKGFGKSFWFLLLMAIFPFCVAFAQTGQYRFRHLTNEDGLPSPRVEYIMQDSRGFMWFGTISGLCRYDGYNFKVYQYEPDDSTSLTHSAIRSNIIEDRNGNLWIGNLFGLNRFDPVTESFKRYVNDPDDSTSLSSNLVFAICEDNSGTIWIGTTGGGGLNRYNQEFDNFTVFKQFQDTGTNSGNNYIISLYEDHNKILWVGTINGIFQFDRRNEKFTQLIPENPLPENFIPRYNAIKEDNNGNLWFVTPKAVLTYKESVLHPLFGNDIQFDGVSFLQDILIELSSVGNILWIASNALIRLNSHSGDTQYLSHEPNNPQSIIGNTLTCIYKDKTEILWISSDHGINILNKELDQIENHDDFYQRYKCDASVCFEDSKGFFWIGTHTKGIVRFDNMMNPIGWYKVLHRDKNGFNLTGVIRTIYEDTEGVLWVGDDASGLYFLDDTRNEFIPCDFQYLKVGEDIIWINTIFEDSNGVLWIGTQSGLFKNHKKTDSTASFILVNLIKPHEYRPVTSICEDRLGYLWVGVNSLGLFCQPPESRGTDTFIHYKHNSEDKNSISSNNIWQVYEDSQGILWITTYRGLNIFNRDSNNFEHIQFQTNPGSNFITDIVEDKHRNFWMTTDNGFIRFKKSSANNSIKNPYEIKQFLPFNDIFPYKISSGKNGRIFIGAKSGSSKGYFSFHPDSIIDNSNIPPLVITNFQINNKPAKLDSAIILKKHILLKYNENFFSFEFAALDYANSKKNRYAYYLEGLETDWIYSDTRRLANYTGVPPGEYTFHTKGSNNDGFWNEDGTSIAITIMPPPWLTWWSYIAYGLIFAGILYIILRYYLKRQQLLQKMELEKLQYEKLEELDQLKSRFFANISHEFRTPLTLILGPLEKIKTQVSEGTKKDLEMMQRNARRLQNLISQLLTLSKLESGKMKLHTREVNIVSLVNGYVQSFESLARQKNIQLIFKSNEGDIRLFVDNDKIEKILFNFLSNAFKFTDAGGRIEVEVTPLPPSRGETFPTLVSNQAWVEIKVSDSGVGIPQNKLEHIFDRFYQADDSYTKDQEGTGIGLALTKEMVEIHFGKITVISELGKGTTFTVYLPTGKDHLKPEEIEAPGDRTKEIDLQDQHEKSIEIHEQSELYDDETDKDTTKPLLMIVEDNSDLRTYIRGYLSNDYKIAEAIDGQMGLEKAIEKIPDLVISDVMMPKMDGYQLCKNLKADERTSHIPIILLTARASRESKIQGLETGADDFVTKPFDADELLIRIKNLIDLRRKLNERFIKNATKVGFLELMELSESDINSMDLKFMKKAVNIVQQHMSDAEFNVKAFGSLMNMSRMQIHRKLIALTGQPANIFIRTLRMNKASILLANKSGNITEVAYDVGFNNLSYFAKCFREQFGISPSEFVSENSDPQPL